MLVSVIGAYAIVLKVRSRALALQLFDALLDKGLLEDHLLKITSDSTMKEIEKTDGFLKFISESRDAAFTYIESVQDAIILYRASLESSDNDMILAARENLFAFLPTTQEENNK